MAARSQLARELSGRFPSRTAQLDLLLAVLHPDIPLPLSVFVNGPRATGKTLVLRELVHIFNLARGTGDQRSDKDCTDACYISCNECYSPKLIYDRVLNHWSGVLPSFETGFGGYSKCNSLSDFVWKVKDLLASSNSLARSRLLVLDNAERLRDLSPTLLPALLRLQELVGGSARICVIFVSILPWENFRTSFGCFEPIVVQFPHYSKEEALDIIIRDCPPLGEIDIYRIYAATMYDMFSRPCSDLNELRHLITLLYPNYMAPVLEGRIEKTQTIRLFRALDKQLKSAFSKLYLREISSVEWAQYTHGTSEQLVNSYNLIDLPTSSKFLLIAAFLASYNPTSLDRQFFVKGREPSKKRRKVVDHGKAAAKDKSGGKLRQQLQGPRTFPVERMLAIFFSIVDDDMDSSIDIQQQIASLITLRLLTRMTPADRLDAMKCKCNVSYDFIVSLAQSVRFSIAECLHDFH